MAKDTEKLIRQLSLISFLMAERRPVSALEIKQDVEGYSEMNDDAFARRFYADRAELEALGIYLKVEKPPEGYFEAELYTLPPENFYLPPIEFSDGELAALQTSLALLDGRFAYAEPLRLALQQLSWGRPSPLGSAEQRSVAVAVTASAGGRELSQRLAKVETAISRRKTIEFELLLDRARRAVASARSTPTTCSTRAASSTSSATRTSATTCGSSACRGSRTRSPTRARPSTTSRRPRTSTRGRTRAAPTGSSASRTATAQVWISERIAWLVERDFGRYGEFAPVTQSGSQWRAGSRRVPGPGRRLHDRVRPAAPAGRHGCSASASTRALLDPPSSWTRPPSGCRRIVERHAERTRLRRRAGPPAPRRRRVGERPPGRAGAATATARPRSAPSASRGWSRSPAS